MILLAVDTTGEQIVLCLQKNREQDFYLGESGARKHNSTLLNEIDILLSKNNLQISDVDCFGVAVGPGSFTGIRVGVATVNAFSLALSKPVVAVTTLEIPHTGAAALTMLSCRHGNYYCGLFSESGEVAYLALNEMEIAAYDVKKIILDRPFPKQFLDKCVIKAERGDCCGQAKPFYLKQSSAERETGVYVSD